MARIPKINESHGSETYNIINRAIEVLNQLGVNVQDLVADGQLTPEQYSELIKTVNGLISKGNVSLNDLSEEAIQLLTDADVTAEFLTIPRDGSVTPRKTDFINVSTNILDMSNAQEYKRIDSNGNEVDSETTNLSDFIELTEGQRITSYGIEFVARYDENFEFVSRGAAYTHTEASTGTHPAHVKYLKFSIYRTMLDVAQVNFGENLLPYERPIHKLKKNIEVDVDPKQLNIADLSGTLHKKQLKDGDITPEKTSFFEFSTNILDEKSMTRGFTIDANTGEIVESFSNRVSTRIKVNPSSSYIGTIDRYALYDKNGDFILSEARRRNFPEKFTTTEDTEYMIVVVNATLEKPMLNKGNTLLPYEEFHKTRLSKEIEIPGTSGGEGNGESSNDVMLLDAFAIEGIVDGYYRQLEPLLERQPWNGTTAKGSNAVSEMYDVFPAEHPEYVTKEVLTHSAVNDREIHRMDFNPNIVNSPDHETKFPKIFIISGIHGTEKVASEVLYRFFDLICNHWQEDELLETLRWNVHFIIIPLANPDGWNGDTRQNGNGIDLNRQFPTGFNSGTEGSSTYGGTEPLTEPEAIAINDILENEEDIIYVCDFHNFSSGGYNFIWNAVGTKFNSTLTKLLVSKVSREWKERYDWYEDGNEGLRGYSSWTPDGSLARHASALGMQSSTWEFTMGNDIDPEDKSYSSNIMTLGTEAFVNWILINLKNNTRLY